MNYDNGLGVDISEGDDLSDQTLSDWQDYGVTHVYVQYSAKLPYYLSRLAGEPFIVDVYVYLYFPLSPWGQLPEDRVKAALKMCQGHDVRCIWLDVEEVTDSDTPAGTVAALQRCVALVQAQRREAGIYTGKDTWNSHTGSSTAFQHLRLWHADYLGEAPTPDMTKRPTSLKFRHGPYGGWLKPDVWQWWNTTMFGGHSVDLNVEDTKEIDMKFILPRPGVATWWHLRNLPTSTVTSNQSGVAMMDAAADLGALPGDVVRFEVRVRGGGPLRFFHGETNLEAGECSYGSTVVEAQVSLNGHVGFFADRGVTIQDLFCLGYWR